MTRSLSFRGGLLALVATMMTGTTMARDIHVSVTGDDGNKGTTASPLLTISAAAAKAQPGDVITVHEGIYRERINPPRGGTSDKKRIVYQAASGERVVIKGSEIIRGWKQEKDDTWKVTLSNRFFGDFNPYSDLITGDWYEARQPYHTGAVYLNGHWLKEAPRKSAVVGGDGGNASELELMNVEFLRVAGAATVPAADRTSQGGDAPVVELPSGKRCLGPLKCGDWLTFEGVDFGAGSDEVSLSTGSPVGGGLVEIRLGEADGELLGRVDSLLTAEWTHFQVSNGKLDKKLSGKQTITLLFKARPVPAASASDLGYWFAEVAEDTTTIWAQFKDTNPNKELVEINVRQSVFYPEETGRGYITVRGFTLEQAATPWSPPTAEQIGLIGAHWCKGWIIEDNTIRYSACTGLTLGKHGDEFDNTHNYNRTIRLGLENGWNRDTIGSHLVRNNRIQHCGQAGIVGSLGCAFSTIIGNEIHEIRQHHQYGGCETAGIKLHGAIDVLIAGNHIYRCEHWGGIWLDWMGQGARVSGNLLHDNSNDLMFEMNHGPMLIDNNILLSLNGVRDASGGGAYVHNLICGTQSIWADLVGRKTPIFKPHSTDVIVSAQAAGGAFGALGGAVARFDAPVENTEQGPVYQTVRYGSKGYRLDVPNGIYTVTLKLNEPFHGGAGSRRFDAKIQGELVAKQLDLAANPGKNHAFDVVSKSVRVAEGVLNIELIRGVGSPCIAGIEVVGAGEQPFTQRINCGGPAWEGFIADFVIHTDESRAALWDQWGGIGFTVDQHDDRFFNNLFVRAKALSAYDEHQFEIHADGNVFLAGALPSKRDRNAIVANTFDPGITLVEKDAGWWLKMKTDPSWQAEPKRSLVTSEVMGKSSVSDAPFENRDGTRYGIDTDYFGRKRDAKSTTPGPFCCTDGGRIQSKVWPLQGK